MIGRNSADGPVKYAKKYINYSKWNYINNTICIQIMHGLICLIIDAERVFQIRLVQQLLG